jgi:DNA-binding FrmR family transcriptional regulator
MTQECSHDKKKAIDRLSRIEGQVRGLRKMLEADVDCFEFLKQASAVIGALRSLSVTVLEEHLRNCVTGAMTNEVSSERLTQDLIQIFNRFSK